MDSASVDTNLILTTKLHPPPVTPELVPRTHLLDRLERNQRRSLTLISAPAGYGKSVLASMWLQNSGRPFGWISLDEDDNDLLAFFAYLLAAIELAVPAAPLQQSQALLELPTLPPIRIVARTLLNDLAQIKEQLFLVLDDIHELHELVIFELLASRNHRAQGSPLTHRLPAWLPTGYRDSSARFTLQRA
jgi:LuxR family maltose regulon positive regulatory protein